MFFVDKIGVLFNKSGTPTEVADTDPFPVSPYFKKYGSITEITDSEPLPVVINTENPSGDAFGRLRVSQALTLFDSKQIHSTYETFFWDEKFASGGGTGSTYRTNEASTRLSVSATTAGSRIRQTLQRFNYQPGKGHRIILTCANLLTSTGNTKGFGYGDDKNGLFLLEEAGQLKFRRRTYVTGSAVDNDTDISKTLPSGTVIDTSKDIILDIDFEWLGVGRIRAGFIDNGVVEYFHTETGTNTLNVVILSTPNLPIRYWIENDGTGDADTFDCICSTVQSEGGQEKTGILQHADSGTITGLTSGSVYAMLGLRLKTDHLDIVSLMEKVSILCSTNNDLAKWSLIFNPTVAGTFTYSDKTNSALQVATGASSNTVTGGYTVDGEFFETVFPSNTSLLNAKWLGSDIDGTTPDELVLACEPITANIDARACATWRELI